VDADAEDVIFRIFPSKVNRLFISENNIDSVLCSLVRSCKVLSCFQFHSLTHSSSRELQKLIKSASSPSSPFHQSHAAGSTDVTVHPPPISSNSTGEPDKKKRKREVEETNDHITSDTQHARFPNVFHTNRHLFTVHETLKKECEQLIELTVGSAFRPLVRCSTFLSSRTRLSCG
jgi:hypothetical protein